MSRNVLRTGARSAPQKKNFQVILSESNLIGVRTRNRIRPAPTNASKQLLRNQQIDIAPGTPFGSWAARWAGKTANASTHQVRIGVSRNAPRRIALGGHSTETGCG